ncbi:similar to stage IV sporulation protein [Salinibacillus kushneri]|uniref:Similar to stage IV sporulation protein n=1 Tax=Salinibacillus kushneri TaxID=237682 RepID=A0A1I0G1Z2_9BACI|nr:sporulation protein YqfD [Salinibacillus kushneri]SET63872.1 similar to stage IV sporulation protein [Salinibacillus kushneri]
MKDKQGQFFKGYITIHVNGRKPELFLNRCMHENISIWDIRKLDENTFEFKVYVGSLSSLKQIRRQMGYKISFKEKYGFPFWLAHLKIRKPLIIGIFLALFFILVLSNMVWQVKIVGVSPEIEYKIRERLDEYGLKQGVFKFSFQSVDDIERNITNELQDVMWIGIEQKGTTYIVQGVEKSQANDDHENRPQNLVASKAGVILEMLVEKGDPQVTVYQKVKKGDILVSGLIREGVGNENSESEKAEEEKNKIGIHAEGEVFAETWYTTETTVPLSYEHQTLTGEKDEHYKLNIGNFTLPIWDFFPPDFADTHTERSEKPLHFLNLKLPFSVQKDTIFEKETTRGERSKEEAISEGIAQAKREIKRHTNHDAEIIDEEILHQSVGNGKVRLELLFTVRENIAKPQPINQGE